MGNPDLVKVAGKPWIRMAQYRSVWRALGEAYVQQWTCYCWYDDDFLFLFEDELLYIYTTTRLNKALNKVLGSFLFTAELTFGTKEEH